MMPEASPSLTQPGHLDDCGCGNCLATRTPIALFNRAGLSAIAYRVGTHALFKQSMLARLSAADLPALIALRTREDDDFAIALLDAWAVVADVLTFYQERIANESYLRTATERLSLLELARLIGYELRPGVAASAYLAFTLEDAPGAPRRVTLESGVQVQSVPGPGEQPQTFETIERIEARAAWNALKPRAAQLPDLATPTTPLYFTGAANNLQKGDALLVAVLALDVSGAPRYTTLFYRIASVTLDHTRQVTRVDVEAENIHPAAAMTSAWHPWVRINDGVFAQQTQLALVARYPDHLDLFGVGLDGGAYSTWWDEAGWHGWYRIKVGNVGKTGTFAQNTPIAAVARYPTHLDLFGVGEDGGVYSAWWDQSDNTWSDWFRIGTGGFTQLTPIAAIARYPDHLDLFGVGTDDRVYSAWWDASASWSDWFRIGTRVFPQQTPITVVARHRDHLDLFAVSFDGRVYSAWWDASATWSNWYRIGSGVFAQNTPIAAIARYPTHLDLFGVGLDGGVYSAWWDASASWSDWYRIGSGVFPLQTPITVVARHPNHLDLFGVGLDGGLYTAWWDASTGWSDWARVGSGVFTQNTPIAAIARGTNHLDLFGVGQNGGVYSAYVDFDENAAPWNPVMLSTPVLQVTPPSATIDPHQIAQLYQTPRPLTDPAIQWVLLNHVWHGSDLEGFAQVQGWSLSDAFAFVATVNGGDLAAVAPEQGIFAFRARASLFGHNAPNWQTLPDSVRSQYAASTFTDWPFPTLNHSAPPPNQLDLDMVYSKIAIDSWVVEQRYHGLINQPAVTIAGRVASSVETGVANYAISAKVTRLQLTANHPHTRAEPASTTDLRESTLYVQSEKLTRAGFPVDVPVTGSAIDLDGLYDGLSAGQAIVVSGMRADLPGVSASEVAVVSDVLHDLTPGGVTWLLLASDLTYQYDRSSTSINANVALATHGETKQEVLGSGDASQMYQRFALHQSPLTYISAPTPSGAQSTLAVRVNDVLWHEADTLYGQGPRDRVFVTHTSDDGTTTVEFGDGQTGARLPTGQENVQATYRKGIGVAGQVKAGQLRLLLSHPLGVKSVLNPQDAAGAADPQSRDDARRAAPLTVLTLDRIVSLQDYQDFAQSYAGIAKALATWTWDRQVRGVFVTVAGPGGASVDEGGILYTNLLEAMRQSAEPYIALRVRSYRKAFFRLAARVKVDPDYRQDDVRARVESALRAQFDFEARTFGQGVALSEVLAVMQGVAGVEAVDLDLLYRSDAPPKLNMTLLAAAPQPGADASVEAAELLTLDPAPLDNLGVMS